MNSKLFVLIFSLCIPLILSSQEQISTPDHIKTILFRPNSPNMYSPFVKIGEKLHLSFDDLSANQQEFTYQIEHYDFDWNPSNLMETEYINGFANDRIRNYENSFNTLQPFTHYSVTIPNQNTKITISGNYVITVFDEDGIAVFNRRFIIYEPRVDVGVTIHKSRDIATIQEQQTVAFIINHPGFRINDPKQEIKPVILQNGNWYTATANLVPQFFRGNQLIYKYTDQTNYWAGNEFLYFENKDIRNTTVTIAHAELGRDLYHTYLHTNDARRLKPYTLNPDINGNFIIRTVNGLNNELDADYTWVYFSLNNSEELIDKDIYINGAFNDWELNDDNRLIFNPENRLYEKAILLKQGFYNYQFVSMDENGLVSNTEIDGSFYQTENDYTVIVYYKKYGSRYDRIIGLGIGNSKKIQN